MVIQWLMWPGIFGGWGGSRKVGEAALGGFYYI